MQQGGGGTAQQAPAPAAVRIEAGPTTAARTIPVPRSAQDVVGLRARRSELVDQLDRAMDARREITAEWERAPGIERAILERVMSSLDGRIAEIEADIAATEQALASAQPGLFAAAAQVEAAQRAAREPGRFDEDVERMVMLFTLFVGITVVLTVARRMWRRTPPPRPVSLESAGRLERIEQAVEAMAIEIERVSEGQRFVTKLMTEAKAVPTLDSGPRQPETHSARER